MLQCREQELTQVSLAHRGYHTIEYMSNILSLICRWSQRCPMAGASSSWSAWACSIQTTVRSRTMSSSALSPRSVAPQPDVSWSSMIALRFCSRRDRECKLREACLRLARSLSLLSLTLYLNLHDFCLRSQMHTLSGLLVDNLVAIYGVIKSNQAIWPLITDTDKLIVSCVLSVCIRC